jgi:hypothetical protein
MITYGCWCVCSPKLIPQALSLLLKEEVARVRYGFSAGYLVGKC